MKSSLAIALLSAFAFAGAEENEHTNAVYISPVSMIIYSGITDLTMISGAYEHRLTQSGYSLFVPLNAAYREDNDRIEYAIGAGLGIRKYFGTSFSGSYLTAQSDLMRYQTYDYVYQNPYMTRTGCGYTRHRATGSSSNSYRSRNWPTDTNGIGGSSPWI
jgi:hypothetical protein